MKPGLPNVVNVSVPFSRPLNAFTFSSSGSFLKSALVWKNGMATDTDELPYLSSFLQELSDQQDFLFGYPLTLFPVRLKSSVTL